MLTTQDLDNAGIKWEPVTHTSDIDIRLDQESTKGPEFIELTKSTAGEYFNSCIDGAPYLRLYWVRLDELKPSGGRGRPASIPGISE